MEYTKILREIDLYKQANDYQSLLGYIKTVLNKADSKHLRKELSYELANVYYEHREFKKSLEVISSLQEQLIANKDDNLLGKTLTLQGKIARVYQRYDKALDFYRKAESSFKHSKDQLDLAKVYHNMGNIYILKLEFKKAKKYHFKALEIFKTLEDNNAIANSYLNLGSMFYQNGEVDEALTYFNKAKDILEGSEDKDTLAAVNLNMAEVYLLRKRYTKASLHGNRALQLYKEANSEVGIIISFTTLARIEKSKGSFTKAIEFYEKGRELAQSIGNPISEELMLELGECYLAENNLERAAKIFKDILSNDKRSFTGVVHALNHLALINFENLDFEESAHSYKQLLEILERSKPRDNGSIIATKANLSLVYLKQKKQNEAFDLFREAAVYYEKKKDFDELLTLSMNFSDFLIEQEIYKEALDILNKKIIPIVKKQPENAKLLKECRLETALLYHLHQSTDQAIKYLLKNGLMKIPDELVPPVLKNTKVRRDVLEKLIHEINNLKELLKSYDDPKMSG